METAEAAELLSGPDGKADQRTRGLSGPVTVVELVCWGLANACGQELLAGEIADAAGAIPAKRAAARMNVLTV